mgnify:CR=1 FL=1
MERKLVKRTRKSKKEQERRFLVGIYLMGWERVDLYVHYSPPGRGGQASTWADVRPCVA